MEVATGNLSFLRKLKMLVLFTKAQIVQTVADMIEYLSINPCFACPVASLMASKPRT